MILGARSRRGGPDGRGLAVLFPSPFLAWVGGFQQEFTDRTRTAASADSSSNRSAEVTA